MIEGHPLSESEIEAARQRLLRNLRHCFIAGGEPGGNGHVAMFICPPECEEVH